MSITTAILSIIVAIAIIRGDATYEQAMLALILIQLMYIGDRIDKHNE